MHNKIIKTVLGCIIIFCVLTGCGDNNVPETEVTETEIIETNIIEENAYLSSITDGSNLVVGEEYLIKDIKYNNHYFIFLYLEKDKNRFIVKLNINNKNFSSIFETGYSPATLCAIYPGDYIKYLGDSNFEWIPKYCEE